MSVFKPFVKYRFRCRFIDAWIMSQLRVYWSTCKINISYEGKVLNPILDRITKVDLKFEAHLFSVWSKIPNFWKLLISLFLETQNSFSPCQFQVKIYLILYNLKWYSTTKVMLLLTFFSYLLDITWNTSSKIRKTVRLAFFCVFWS